MSNLGITVLIKRLFGENSESAKVFSGAIGKTFADITLGEDDELHFKFTDGTALKVSDLGQSCCEDRYMRTDDDLKSFIGAQLLGGEIKDAPDGESEYGDHEIQFLEIQTSSGVFTMASHNEHNGYYGGFCIEAAAE